MWVFRNNGLSTGMTHRLVQYQPPHITANTSLRYESPCALFTTVKESGPYRVVTLKQTKFIKEISIYVQSRRHLFSNSPRAARVASSLPNHRCFPRRRVSAAANTRSLNVVNRFLPDTVIKASSRRLPRSRLWRSSVGGCVDPAEVCSSAFLSQACQSKEAFARNK